MRRPRVQGSTKLGSISEIVGYVASSNHAKFHAFLLKLNNFERWPPDYNALYMFNLVSNGMKALMRLKTEDYSKFFFCFCLCDKFYKEVPFKRFTCVDSQILMFCNLSIGVLLIFFLLSTEKFLLILYEITCIGSQSA